MTQSSVECLIIRKIFSVTAQEAAPTPAPAHALAPALAQLSVVDPSSSEPVGFAVAGTLGVYTRLFLSPALPRWILLIPLAQPPFSYLSYLIRGTLGDATVASTTSPVAASSRLAPPPTFVALVLPALPSAPPAAPVLSALPT